MGYYSLSEVWRIELDCLVSLGNPRAAALLITQTDLSDQADAVQTALTEVYESIAELDGVVHPFG